MYRYSIYSPNCAAASDCHSLPFCHSRIRIPDAHTATATHGQHQLTFAERMKCIKSLDRCIFLCWFNGRSISIWYVCLYFECVRYRMPNQQIKPNSALNGRNMRNLHGRMTYACQMGRRGRSFVAGYGGGMRVYASAHFPPLCGSVAPLTITAHRNQWKWLLFINMRHNIDLVEPVWSVSARASQLFTPLLFGKCYTFTAKKKTHNLAITGGRRRMARRRSWHPTKRLVINCAACK